MTELLAAVIGAVVAYVGGWSQQQWQRRRERKSLATIMLQELRTLDVTTRYLYASANRGRVPSNAIRVLHYHSEALSLFRPSTVRELLEIAGLLNALLEVQNEVQGGVLDPTHSTALYVRATAYAIVHRVETLKRLP